MFTATRSSYQRSLDKAKALGTVKTIHQVNASTYRVPGVQSVYTVTVAADGEQACSCPAGQAGRPCYHSAAVWLQRVAEAATALRPATRPARESSEQVRARLKADLSASVTRWGVEGDLDGAA